MGQPLTQMVLSETPKTPLVRLDQESGHLEFRGRSIPENAVEFFGPIVNWIKEFSETKPAGIRARVELEYFNTSSSKCILDVFKALEAAHSNGIPVEVDWIYEEDDEDILEAGEDYQSIVRIPFNLVESEG